jgi:hypothetical protein
MYRTIGEVLAAKGQLDQFAAAGHFLDGGAGALPQSKVYEIRHVFQRNGWRLPAAFVQRHPAAGEMHRANQRADQQRQLSARKRRVAAAARRVVAPRLDAITAEFRATLERPRRESSRLNVASPEVLP